MPLQRPIRTPLLLTAQDGVAYVEFAISLTLLLLLFLGSIEVTRAILILQKLEKTVETVANVVTQASTTDPLTASQMTALMGAVQDMMNPYTFGSGGLVIVTDITQAGASNPVVNWQYCGGGTLAATSQLGTTIGGAATLPAGFTMNAGEEAVITEIFYNYVPLTTTQWSVMTASTIYRTATFMPRLGSLTGFSSHC